MNSNYISSPSTPTKLHRRGLGKLVCILAALFAVVSLTGFSGVATAKQQQAEAFDPIQWLACRFGEGSYPRAVYQVTQTSDLQFELFSKSHSGSGADDVRSGLNAVLDYVMTEGDAESPYSFEKVNERIIGQNFAGTLPVDSNAYKRWNKGPTVNPYNRFGVAGLKFSNYMGEWKHLFIDACEDDDSPDATYDTGASTNVVKVASWNVCSWRGVCNMPDFNNPETGQPFTVEEIWDPFSERVSIGAEREMQVMDPDIFLAQEVTSTEPGGEKVFEEDLCGATGMTYIPVENARKICYNPEKFTPVSNDAFQGAQGDFRFPAAGLGTLGGFAWAVMEDQSYRRSVFISVHLAPGEERDQLREAQTKYLVNWINDRFSGSFYPIVMGGDWNALDPISCDKVGQLPPGRDSAAKVLCGAGYKSTNELATTPIDLEKASFQGFTPWKSKNGGHIDHIWVNGYVGVGESRVYAPAGPAMSDHVMVSSVVNLNGTSVASPGDPQDPQTNKYYDTRLEPRSTWEDISTSADVRTQQFSSGFFERFDASVTTGFINAVFFLTKLIVVFTIALIGLAFTDISKLLGVTDLVVGSGGQNGLFQQLHNNLFMPLVVIAIVFTGVHLFWQAVVKRQVRSALGSTLKAVICFFIAVVISVSPAWFITLPNNVAIVGQALVAQQLNSGLAGGNSLCASNIDVAGTVLEGAENADATDSTQAAGLLERASVNMQSSAGCMLWYNLLLRPWAEGQFGSEYTELYGTQGGECVSNMNPDTISDTDPQDFGPEGKHVCLGYDKEEKKNRNFLWVGDPVVPLGGGQCANENNNACDAKLEANWALFQISTQTNAHAPLLPPEDRGVASAYSQGVAHDWWRVVDAVSNYHEESSTDNLCQSIECSTIPPGTKTAPYPHALKNDTMQEWDTWVGNNQGHRVATVFSSLLIAFFASLAPLVFSALAAIYGVGISILMAFAPIFFLLGCWAGKGWEIFKAWGDLVINTTMKRIALGIMTVLSISFTAAILEQMQEIGYWKSMILLAIISIVLVKSRQKIFSAVSFARFSSMDLSSTANRLTNTVKESGKVVGGMAGAAAVGGATSAAGGNGFMAGARIASKAQMENLSYRSRTLRAALDTKMLIGDEFEATMKHEKCVVCGFGFEPDQFVSRLNGPNLYGYAHSECVQGKDSIDAVEIGSLGADRVKTSEFNSERVTRLKRSVKSDTKDVDGRLEDLTRLVITTNEEISRFQIAKKARAKTKRRVDIPELPKEIADYVDVAAIGMAWEEGEYEYIKLAYTAGWIAWARENGLREELNEATRLNLLSRVQHTDNELRDRY